MNKSYQNPNNDATAEYVPHFTRRSDWGWRPGFRAVIRPEGWAMIISKSVWGQKRRRDWYRFYCYLGALLTFALLCAMAWLLANYHPEKKVSEAVTLEQQPTKGAPAVESFPPSGANPTGRPTLIHPRNSNGN